MKKNMRKILASLSFLAGIFLLVSSTFAEAPVEKPLAYIVEIKGVISPATYDLIARHLDRAAEKKAAVVILQMHTPGGLYDSTQDIIQKILDSSVPVVTYVSPGGSHAASAGTYILYASHIAAMSPGTNIGAATPVQMGQGGAPVQEEKSDATMPKKTAPASSTMEQKMVNDASAYIRGLAELRGRNVEWAEKAVRDAESLTASEALSKKVIDIIADDIPSLLSKIDGKEVKMGDGSKKTLKTKDAAIESITPDWRHDLLSIITHPNVAFLLMTLGTYGLIYELANPGTFFPGVVGSICLLLGLFAMNILPINYAGLALIFTGLALMAGEALVPAFGVLGIGGAIAFVTGAMMLIDSDVPGYGIDIWVIAGTTVASLGILSLLLAMALKSQKRPTTTGVEELLAAPAEVVTWSQGRGDVRVTGEIWQATADAGFILKPGDKVAIVAIDGLILTVTPQK